MWPCSVCFCSVLTIVAVALGGEVLKTDDSLVSGTLLSFDGQTLFIQPRDGTVPLVSIPIRDIARVQFTDPSDRNRNPDPIRPRAPGELPALWQLKLANGDRISGTLDSWSETQFALRAPLQATLHVPIRAIREAWRAAPDLVRKARALKESAATTDVAYVLKDDEVVAARGTVLGVQNNFLEFIYEGRQRGIKIERVLGVVLAPQKRQPASRPAVAPQGQPARLLTLDGDILTGHWKSMKPLSVFFETSWNETVELRTSGVSRIETREGGAVTYLSDLKPVKVEQTPYFDRVIPFRVDSSLDGGPLRLNDGHQYVHGVAVHSRCVLVYELAGQFARFNARLGFEPIPSGSPVGRVAVRVLADETSRFEDADFRSDGKPRDLDIDVRGATRLTLEVDFGPDQDVNDRVVWADAKIVPANGDK